MDNIKKARGRGQDHFWIICGVSLLVIVVCWWLATNSLAAQFKKRQGELDNDFKSVVVPAGHPNQAVIDKVKQQDGALKKERLRRLGDPLPPTAGEEPDPEVVQRRAEAMVPEARISRPSCRRMIGNFTRTRSRTICRRKGDHRRPSAAGGKGCKAGRCRESAATECSIGHGRPGHDSRDDWLGTVDWNDNDYHAIEALFTWSEPPSTLAVAWRRKISGLTRKCCKSSRKTNEGAANHAGAAVKEINALQIGRCGSWLDRIGKSTVRTGQHEA